MVYQGQRPQRAQQAQQQHPHGSQQRRRRQHPQCIGQEGKARHAPAPHHACRAGKQSPNLGLGMRRTQAPRFSAGQAGCMQSHLAAQPQPGMRALPRTYRSRRNHRVRRALQHAGRRGGEGIHGEARRQHACGGGKHAAGDAQEEQEAVRQCWAVPPRHGPATWVHGREGGGIALVQERCACGAWAGGAAWRCLLQHGTHLYSHASVAAEASPRAALIK